MASIRSELAEKTVEAAQWIVDCAIARDLPTSPILPLMRERFGLSQLQAVQALFEAVYTVARAEGLSHEQAFHAGMTTLAAEASRTATGARA